MAPVEHFQIFTGKNFKLSMGICVNIFIRIRISDWSDPGCWPVSKSSQAFLRLSAGTQKYLRTEKEKIDNY